MLKPGFNVLIDGQWGSTGKGKVAAYIADTNHIDIAVSDFQANAGHTSIIKGKKFVVHSVPTTAGVNDRAINCINPGATLDLKRLFHEIDLFNLNEDNLKIHPHACIIQDHHKEIEGKIMHKISSTCQGVGAALSEKIMRGENVKLAKDIPELKKFIIDTTVIINAVLRCGGTVFAETAQGFDLSINHGKTYPYVTSRDVTVGSTLNNSGVSPYWVSEVIGVLRTYPIRVGDAYDKEGNKIGTSGGYYSDQEELTWEEVTKISGADHDLLERTTVTNKIRRIFTFSKYQLCKFLTICRPTQLAITFMDYIDWKMHGIGRLGYFETFGNKNIEFFLNEIKTEIINAYAPLDPRMRTHPCKITYLGTGPENNACLYKKEGF